MNNKLDPLARWWWPGQWLHIVWGVWIDQLWYWQNVRPRLRDQKLGQEILVQGILGTLLVALIISGVQGGILSAMRVQINWNLLAVGALVGVLALTVLRVIFARGKGMTEVVVDIAAIGMFVSIVLSAFLGAFSDKSNGGMVARLVMSGVWGVIWGTSLNVAEIVTQGDTRSIGEAVFGGMIIGVAVGIWTGIFMFIATAIVATLGSGIGLYLGEHLAIRQIPDENTRKQLADPDVRRPKIRW